MRIAILIMIHRFPEQLALQFNCLVHNDIDIFVHIDKKNYDTNFKRFITTPNTHFIDNRTSIEWGAFSIVDKIINCFVEILDYKKFDYICNISGQILPIKNMSRLINFINENNGSGLNEKISNSLDDSLWQENSIRINKYSLINLKFKGKYKIEKIFNGLTPTRKALNNHMLSGNSGWFCLSNEVISLVMSSYKHNKKLNHYFKFVWGEDETYISTSLYNSSFKDKLIGNLIYTEWLPNDKSHPKVFTLQDKVQLQQSNKIFARKFDYTIDKEIIESVQTLSAK